MAAVLNSLATRVPRTAPSRRGAAINIELVGHYSRARACVGHTTRTSSGRRSNSLDEHSRKKVELNILGERARGFFFRRRQFPVRHEDNVLHQPSFRMLPTMAKVIEEFVKEKKSSGLDCLQ